MKPLFGGVAAASSAVNASGGSNKDDEGDEGEHQGYRTIFFLLYNKSKNGDSGEIHIYNNWLNSMKWDIN